MGDSFKKGQTWSLDLMIGTGVFIVIFMSVFAYITFISDEGYGRDLKSESEIMLSSLESKNSGIGFIRGNEIDKDILLSMASYGYQTELGQSKSGYEFMQAIVGTKYDYCIFLEDENGNLLDLQGNFAGDGDYVGIGSSDLKVNGIKCGVPPE